MSTNVSFLPMGSATGIGSLPHKDVQEAIQGVAQLCPEIPFWPQLPHRSAQEYMIEQALGSRNRFFIPRTADYGQEIKTGLLQECLHDFYHGKATLDEHTAAGFFAFEHAIASGTFPRARALKSHCVGPITLACQLFDGDQAFLFNPDHLAAIRHGVAQLALWQTQRLQQWNLPTICFLDEPCLALLTHKAYQNVTKQAVEALRQVVQALQATGVLVGIHCCARNPPFQLIYQVSPDIISFDAYENLEAFVDDKNTQEFLNAGGLVAFGMVPTTIDLSRLDPTSLFTRWLLAFTDIGDIRQIAMQTLVTATCGLGLLAQSQATAALQMTERLAALVKKVALS